MNEESYDFIVTGAGSADCETAGSAKAVGLCVAGN